MKQNVCEFFFPEGFNMILRSKIGSRRGVIEWSIEEEGTENLNLHPHRI